MKKIKNTLNKIVVQLDKLEEELGLAKTAEASELLTKIIRIKNKQVQAEALLIGQDSNEDEPNDNDCDQLLEDLKKVCETSQNKGVFGKFNY